ncbi:MAG: hypothetical protein ACYC35_26720 [Pirellulales bacterium]
MSERRWDRRALAGADRRQPLFDHAAPAAGPTPQRPNHPSRARTRAASAAASEKANTRAPSLAARVLGAIAASGQWGLIDEEIARAVIARPDTARARRVGLLHAGCIMDSGRRRLTLAGCQSTVWVAAEKQARPLAALPQDGTAAARRASESPGGNQPLERTPGGFSGFATPCQEPDTIGKGG